jgi:hypothetical protein
LLFAHGHGRYPGAPTTGSIYSTPSPLFSSLRNIVHHRHEACNGAAGIRRAPFEVQGERAAQGGACWLRLQGYKAIPAGSELNRAESSVRVRRSRGRDSEAVASCGGLSELPRFTPCCNYGSGSRTREFRRFLGLWAKCSPKGLLFTLNRMAPAGERQ